MSGKQRKGGRKPRRRPRRLALLNEIGWRARIRIDVEGETVQKSFVLERHTLPVQRGKRAGEGRKGGSVAHALRRAPTEL